MTSPATFALFALALATLPRTARAGSDETWVALSVPSLCAPPPVVVRCERLALGSHLLLPGEDIDPAPAAEPGSLALAALLGWLEEDAGRRKLAVRYHPSGPPLLVRGDAASVAQARALIDELSAAGAARAIELRAWLVDGEADVATTHPDRATFTRCVGARAPWATATLTSGESTVLGTRTTSAYVAGYTVEVATDSGVADPTIGRIASGRTLHVRACRVRSGTALHIEGLLDLAPKVAIADFESGTPELGVVQVPTVASVQVAFAGVVDSGGLLAVVIRGASIEPAACTLWLEARTKPDARGNATPPRTLRSVDLALLESRSEELPLPRPGFGIEFQAPNERALLRESLPAASVAEIGADSSRGGGSSGGRAPRAAALWFPGFFTAGADDTATWTEIDALVAGSERDCLANGEIALQHGTLRVLAPVCARCSTRVLAGAERTQLVDYDVQVAQDTWMPHPRVDHIFDGVCVQGHFDGATFSCSAWRASSAITRELDRKQLGIARLPLVERSFASAAAEVERAAPRTLIEADASGLALVLELRTN
jgi:hypothetical protein